MWLVVTPPRFCESELCHERNYRRFDHCCAQRINEHQALSGEPARFKWVRKIYVVDSGSTDVTQDVARSLGAEVVHHDWPGYARQRNWALSELDFSAHPQAWTLILDADEVVPEDLRAELTAITERPLEQVEESGFYINRLTWFSGKPIRHCGYFPSYHLRLMKTGRGRYEDREVHEHLVLEGKVGRIDTPMLHDDRRGLEHYVAKHNRYSTLEAYALSRESFHFRSLSQA